MTAATILLHVVTLGWGVLMGAVIYEHVAVVPVWAAQPPASLAMWRGDHRLRAERFWMGVHPVLLLALIATVALTWSATDLRNSVLVTVAGYVLVLAVTAVWFVPELLHLTTSPDGAIPAAEWSRRARRWELLSICRGVFMLGLSWPLLRALAAT